MLFRKILWSLIKLLVRKLILLLLYKMDEFCSTVVKLCSGNLINGLVACESIGEAEK